MPFRLTHTTPAIHLRKEQGGNDKWWADEVSEGEREKKDGETERVRHVQWNEEQSLMPLINVYMPRQMKLEV